MTTTKQNKNTVQVEKKPHPTSSEHTLCIITTKKGLSWYASWAGEPTDEEIRQAWAEDKGRRDFIPYRGF